MEIVLQNDQNPDKPSRILVFISALRTVRLRTVRFIQKAGKSKSKSKYFYFTSIDNSVYTGFR